MKAIAATFFSMIIAASFLFLPTANASISENHKTAGIRNAPSVSRDCSRAKKILLAAYHNPSKLNLSRMRRLLSNAGVTNCTTIPKYLYPSNWEHSARR